MSEQEQRIRCRYCGSNNFTGTTTCWQCNRPLLISQNSSDLIKQPGAVQSSPADNWDRPGVPALPTYSSQADRNISDKTAIALGFLFPLIGYPVGMVFMMLDDPRKTQIGRLTLLWSTIGLVVTVVFSLMLTPLVFGVASKLMPSGGGDSLTKSLSGDGL